MTLRKRVPRGLRPGEELLVEVECRILDATGTGLPDGSAPAIVGVSDARILVWDIARLSPAAGKLLGVVSRSRHEGTSVERAGPRTRVRLDFEDHARVVIDAWRERHPEQIVWALSADPGRSEQ
jgi:hypothetical protein